ncbi:MAG: LacI family transcriptional regulator [Gammaproteobacteria bacterium]|nr:LacI family transcriptional regulator [Gammaproteobacteria bacterium]
MKKSITIDEIATIAKVSKSTVSKALNNRADIGKETKKRILEIARQHEFIPHPFGKGLKSKITENIGVIFCREVLPISANPFYSRVLEGVEAETAINNRNLMLQFGTEGRIKDVPKMIRERQIDGVILIGNMTFDFIDLIKSKNIPLVLIDPQFETDSCSQIVMDNEHGAFLAIQYLIKMGHRRIGFISGDINRLSFKQRYSGYIKAMKQYSLDIDNDLIATGGMENGYEYTKKLLSAEEPPTAIFSTNDTNAHFGYKAARDLGLKIPEDISFIGFDDIDMSHMISPPLTTIKAYKEELGSIAVRVLLKKIEKSEIRNHTNIIPVRLVERDSVRKI